MKIGYARVSTKDQNLEMQTGALKEYGCELIYSEKISAIKTRPELEKMNQHLRSGDTVVVWKLDRLGRSLKQLIELINWYKENDIQFISISDNMDTTTAQGRLIFNVFASFAEFERELASERTKAGLAAARLKGRKGGRPKGLSKESQTKAWAIYGMLNDTKHDYSAAEIQRVLNVPKNTYYRFKNWAIE